MNTNIKRGLVTSCIKLLIHQFFKFQKLSTFINMMHRLITCITSLHVTTYWTKNNNDKYNNNNNNNRKTESNMSR